MRHVCAFALLLLCCCVGSPRGLQARRDFAISKTYQAPRRDLLKTASDALASSGFRVDRDDAAGELFGQSLTTPDVWGANVAVWVGNPDAAGSTVVAVLAEPANRCQAGLNATVPWGQFVHNALAERFPAR